MEQLQNHSPPQSHEELIAVAEDALASGNIIRFSGRPSIIYDMQHRRDIFYDDCQEITVDCLVSGIYTRHIDEKLNAHLGKEHTGSYQIAVLVDVNAPYEYIVALRCNDLKVSLEM